MGGVYEFAQTTWAAWMEAVRILRSGFCRELSFISAAQAFNIRHPFDGLSKWRIITQTTIDHTRALLDGYIPRETTGMAACTMIWSLAHARLAVYAPPRMEMAFEATARLGESPSPSF